MAEKTMGRQKYNQKRKKVAQENGLWNTTTEIDNSSTKAREDVVEKNKWK